MLVLDTNIISYQLRGHSLAEIYRPFLTGHVLAICFVTVAEMRYGARRAGWGQRRMDQLDLALRQYLVLPFDINVCHQWAEVRVARRTAPIASEDAWIAATCLSRGLPLVTHDARDFAGIPGLEIITASTLA